MLTLPVCLNAHHWTKDILNEEHCLFTGNALTSCCWELEKTDATLHVLCQIHIRTQIQAYVCTLLSLCLCFCTYSRGLMIESK